MNTLLSTSYFSKALSVANTAITMAKNAGDDAATCVEKSLKDVIQAIVDVPEARFATAAANMGLMDKPVLMDGTLTPFSNMLVSAASIVVNDALALKKDFPLNLSEDALNERILAVYKANDFVRKEQKLRTSGMKADPNAVAEDGCGGACRYNWCIDVGEIAHAIL